MSYIASDRVVADRLAEMFEGNVCLPKNREAHGKSFTLNRDEVILLSRVLREWMATQ